MFSVCVNKQFLSKEELNLLGKTIMCLINMGYKETENPMFTITDDFTHESVCEDNIGFNIQSPTFKQDMLCILY